MQFAVDPRDGREFAIKLFLQREAFGVEAALYAACFPSLRTHLSPTLMSRLTSQGVQQPPFHQTRSPLMRSGAEPDAASTHLAASVCEDADGGIVNACKESDPSLPVARPTKENALERDTAPSAGQRRACDVSTGGPQPTTGDGAIMHCSKKLAAMRILSSRCRTWRQSFCRRWRWCVTTQWTRGGGHYRHVSLWRKGSPCRTGATALSLTDSLPSRCVHRFCKLLLNGLPRMHAW